MTVNKRIVKCQVTDEYVIGAGVPLGAEGSHDDVLLELTFSDLWQGLTKSITWWNALGEPVRTILTIEHIDIDNTNVYRVPVPAEAKAVAGDMEVTIKGAYIEEDIEKRATVSVTAQFKVLPGKWAADAPDVQDVTPTQAEQIQAGIDKVMDDIILAVKASEAAQASETAAKSSETAAAVSEAAAETARVEAEQSRDAAKVSENNARTSENAANQSETAAKASEEAAAKSAAAAQVSETAAKESETAAKTSEDNTKTSEINAKASETAAKSSETAAKASETAAKSSENAAKTAKDKAEAAQAAAEKAKNEAEGIAGGDYISRTEAKDMADHAERNANSYTDQKISEIPAPDVSGQIGEHNTSKDAHSDIRKSLSDHAADQSNPHVVTKSQVGLGNVDNTADTDKPVSTAQGEAISDAVRVHNEENSAHSDIRESITELSNRVTPISKGGTGATTAAQALANLGVAAKDLSNVELSVQFEKTAMSISAAWISVTYGNGKFVAVARSINKAAYSEDGINWTQSTMPISADWYSATYGNGKFVAVARNSNKAVYSEDGINWTQSTMPISATWRSVTYGNGKFVAVAQGSNIAAYSITINFIESLTDFGYSKIEVGSYVGTGTYGTLNRCSLTFSSTPKIVFIKSSGDSKVMILFYGHTRGDSTGSTSSSGEPQTTWNGNKVTWYTESSADVQFNSSGETYDYLAFF